eukprot:m51a1_g2266 hypothetical protein (760) ;mRNA; r:345158-348398
MEFRVAAVLRGHQDKVTCCAFSPDGSSLVSGSFDTSVRVWDAATGAQTATLVAHTHTVISCAFMPLEPSRVISAAWDGTIRIWDTATCRPVHVFTSQKQRMPSCCALSPNGKYIAVGSRADTTLRLWESVDRHDVTTYQLGSAHYVRCCAFSPDGSVVLTGSDDATLRAIDLRARKPLAAIDGHSAAVTCCAFSPDGTLIVSGSDDLSVRTWDWRNLSSSPRDTFHGHKKPVSSCSFSPSGEHVVTGSFDNTLRLWSLSERCGAAVFQGHCEEVRCCAFSPRGNQIASGSYDCTLISWDRGPRGPSVAPSTSPALPPNAGVRSATPKASAAAAQPESPCGAPVAVLWTPLEMFFAGTHARLGAQSPVSAIAGESGALSAIAQRFRQCSVFTSSASVLVCGEDEPEPEDEAEDDDEVVIPPLVREVKTAKPVASISCGSMTTTAVLESGELFVWGSNKYGELGLNTRTTVEKPQVNPFQWQGKRILQVHSGYSHSIALLNTGELLGWGKNDDGQLGIAETRAKPSPQPITAFNMSRRVLSLAVGSSHNMALLQNGSLYAWGHNDYGQLGLGDTINRSVPQPVPGFPRAEGRVLQVACGDLHTVVLLDDGSVFWWGADRGAVQSQPQQMKFEDSEQRQQRCRVARVCCGGFHTAALTEDGTLFTWGKNDRGQLGLGHYEDQQTPCLVEALDGETVRHVACGSNFTVALTDECAWGWGDNTFDQLAGLRSAKLKVPKRLKLPDGRAITGVACGRRHVVLAVQ